MSASHAFVAPLLVLIHPLHAFSCSPRPRRVAYLSETLHGRDRDFIPISGHRRFRRPPLAAAGIITGRRLLYVIISCFFQRFYFVVVVIYLHTTSVAGDQHARGTREGVFTRGTTRSRSPVRRPVLRQVRARKTSQ